jgi:hypothetical protein
MGGGNSYKTRLTNASSIISRGTAKILVENQKLTPTTNLKCVISDGRGVRVYFR